MLKLSGPGPVPLQADTMPGLTGPAGLIASV